MDKNDCAYVQIQNNKQFGKFDTAESLLKAYNCLESEFTKKCKLLSEANKLIDELKCCIAELDLKVNNITDDEDFVASLLDNQKIADMFIEKYLVKLSGAQPINTLCSNLGSAALTAVQKPKSLSEARRLAAMLLGK